MSATDAKPPKKYFSRYEHGLDEKRRVQIPAKWRPEEANTELTLVVWLQHKAGACIRVLPPHEFERVLALVEGMPNSDRKVLLMRAVGSESEPVTLDKAGRIVLPDNMAQAAGLQKDAILAGCINCFEIWNPERYSTVKGTDPDLAREAFTSLG